MLSIHPFWAWSIIFAGKDVENRDWQTPYRGPLLIHASKKKYSKADTEDARRIIAKRSGLPLDLIPTDPPRSTMLGVVDLVDVVERSRSVWKGDTHYHFVLKNPRYLEPAVAGVNGKLNVWKWTAP